VCARVLKSILNNKYGEIKCFEYLKLLLIKFIDQLAEEWKSFFTVLQGLVNLMDPK